MKICSSLQKISGYYSLQMQSIGTTFFHYISPIQQEIDNILKGQEYMLCI